VNCIIQAGTPAGFVGKPGWDRELSARLQKLTGIPTATMMSACIDALRELGLKRIVVATPYVDELNVKLKETLEAAGFEVLAFKGLGVLRNIDINKLPPEASYQSARDVFRQAPDADGVFISCGGWPTFENIPLLEQDLGVPVVSSNSAGLWMGLKLAGLPAAIPGLGRLFQESRVASLKPILKRVGADAG
jgi:maleate cis-trans isomerase